jgi:hypothetical protein
MVTDKADHNEQIDDILQSKKDVLRAQDIMPPYDKSAEEAGEDKEPSKTKKEESAQPSSTPPVKSEIPRFDLAKDIMAEHRKITATRRKRPGGRIEAVKTEEGRERVGYAPGWSAPAQPYQRQIIAEIVARDIERLCRGDYSAEAE